MKVNSLFNQLRLIINAINYLFPSKVKVTQPTITSLFTIYKPCFRDITVILNYFSTFTFISNQSNPSQSATASPFARGNFNQYPLSVKVDR